MVIAENILDILSECSIDGNVIYLPDGQLDRKVYLSVSKCLENIGGKWSRKEKGHVFDHDPSDEFENLLLTGRTEDLKKSFQFFPTPKPVAELLCDLAELDCATSIFEPQCGRGDLADVIYERNQNLFCNELNIKMKPHLESKPYTTIYTDFLDIKPDEIKSFDRIVMNPPFSRQQDVMHVYHAYDLLKADGILVSVMCYGTFFRTNQKSVAFRTWLDDVGAEIIEVEAGAFKESGTPIRTKVIKVRKTVA